MPRIPAILLATALLALVAWTGTADAALKRGSRGPYVAKVQRWLGLHADGIFGPRHAARREALAAPARAHAGRRRRPRHVAGAAARPRARPSGARSRPLTRRARAAPAAGARHHRRRHLRPRHAARRPALPAPPRLDRGRRRRAGDLGRARPSGHDDGAQAARRRRRGSAAGPRSSGASSRRRTASPTSRTSTAAATGSGTTRATTARAPCRTPCTAPACCRARSPRAASCPAASRARGAG